MVLGFISNPTLVLGFYQKENTHNHNHSGGVCTDHKNHHNNHYHNLVYTNNHSQELVVIRNDLSNGYPEPEMIVGFSKPVLLLGLTYVLLAFQSVALTET